MQRKGILSLIVLSVLLLSVCPQSLAEEGPNTTHTGVILLASDIGVENLTGSVDSVDILALLNSANSQVMNEYIPVALFSIGPGEALSPNAIRPASEVIYIINGTADVFSDDSNLSADVGDALLIPSGSIMMVKNTGIVPLVFFSFISAESSNEVSSDAFIKRTPQSKEPVSFGNESEDSYLLVNRMFSTFEEDIPVSFDLAVITIPAGKIVPEHYVDRVQSGYILSGEGNVSIGCIEHQVHAGDIVYIPPGAVQRYDATRDLKILLITHPFYVPGEDFPVPGICSSSPDSDKE
jgi:quercetin dioxygenase-like cupin family protein